MDTKTVETSEDSYDLEWLFDQGRIDHLPIEDQLKFYRGRDLSRSKLFRFGIGLWDTLPPRKRRLTAPAMGPIDNTATVDEPEPNVSPTPKQSLGKLSTVTPVSAVSACDNEKTALFWKWLQDRKNLRKSIDNFVQLEDWLAGKSDKTDLERRVLEQLLEEKDKKNRKCLPPEEPPLEESLPDVLPVVRRPSPGAMMIIEKFLYDRQIRLIDLFQEVDKNKDWMLTRDEFKAAIIRNEVPLSIADVDDLMVVFDDKDTGKIDYRQFARCLKLWRQEKKDKKKWRQRIVLSADDNERNVEFGQIMGFELESENGSRFTSRVHSAAATTPRHVGQNTFLVIGTDPPSSKSSLLPASAPGKLESLPVGKLIPITVGVLIDQTENSVGFPGVLPNPKRQLLPRRTTSHVGSHSAPVNSMRTASWRRTKRHQTTVPVGVEIAHLKPAEPDLREERMVLSSFEKLTDAKSHNKHVLRLKNSGRLRADKRIAADERPAIAVIKTGDPDIDGHCSSSTLSGEVGDRIDAYRQQQLRVFTDACQLCRQRGVVLSERLLRTVLLHPGDKPRAVIKYNIRQPSQLLSSADYAKFAPSSLTTRFLGNSHGNGHVDGTGSSTAAAAAVAIDESNDKTGVSIDNEVQQTRDSSLTTLPIHRKRRPAESVRLSTGKAVITSKVDCWLSFEEYIRLTKHLSPRKFDRVQQRADVNADWTGRLLDKIRLVLPSGEDCKPSSSIFQSIRGGEASRCPGRHKTGLRAWPINDSGYVQYGTLVK